MESASRSAIGKSCGAEWQIRGCLLRFCSREQIHLDDRQNPGEQAPGPNCEIHDDNRPLRINRQELKPAGNCVVRREANGEDQRVAEMPLLDLRVPCASDFPHNIQRIGSRAIHQKHAGVSPRRDRAAEELKRVDELASVLPLNLFDLCD